MRVALLPLLSILFVLLAPAVAQKPRTAEEALAKFAKVTDRPEAERQRALGDLGDFTSEAITTTLLAELQRATGNAYRSACVRALGEHPRGTAAIAPLQALLTSSKPSRFCETVAQALAAQGDDGVRALGGVLSLEQGQNSRRQAICEGLARVDSPAARAALLADLPKAQGRDRLPVLRALQKVAGDAAADAARVQCAKDNDWLIAATALQQLAEHGHAEAPTLAAELAKRAGQAKDGEVHLAILLGLLRGPSPANHDALLAAASAAEDPFARGRVAIWQQALQNVDFVRWLASTGSQAKDSRALERIAQALGLVPAEHRALAAPALTRLLGHKDPAVARAAAAGLVPLGPEFALAPLQKWLTTANETQAPTAMAALHELRSTDPAWATELLALAESKLASARAAALQLLASTHGDAAPKVVVAGLGLDHKQPTVRGAAIDLLLALRDPAGVPLLFARLDTETGRLRAELVAALQDLTALQFPTTAAWRDWWAKEGASFRCVAKKDGKGDGKGKGGGTTASYWDLPVTSDRVAFVVDISGSMNQPFGTGDYTRLDEAKRQLVRVLGMLPKTAKANILAFGDDCKALAEQLQPLDDRRRKAAEAFAQGLQIKGATNVYAGLHKAFADPEVDTIFLLTDGQPSAGPIVEAEPLLREVLRWNLGRALRIHTVAIGGKSSFLEKLATGTGGNHTVAR